MKKIQLEQELTTKKRVGFLTVSIIVTIVALSIAQLVLSNHLASYGAEILALSTKEKSYQQENELLVKEISQYSSLFAVAQRASQLSFVKPSKFLVVHAEESVALVR